MGVEFWVGCIGNARGHRDGSSLLSLSPRPDHGVHERIIDHRYRPRTIRRRPRFVHLRSVRVFLWRFVSARPGCCCVFYYWRIMTSRYSGPACTARLWPYFRRLLPIENQLYIPLATTGASSRHGTPLRPALHVFIYFL
jgi:hypothetical protein